LELQKEKVQKTQNSSLIKLHQEALKIIVRAQEQLENGNLVPAFQLLQAATRMSSRIQRELKTASTDFEKIALENKYRRVQEMLNRLESNTEIAQQYELILRQLRQFAEQALHYIESGSFLLAEEYLNTALEQIRQYTLKWRKPAE
jgi:hypothetical protein